MYIFVKGDISSRKHKPYFFFRNRISCAADCNACGIIPQYTAVCGFYFGIYAVFGQFIAGCIVAFPGCAASLQQKIDNRTGCEDLYLLINAL